MNKKEKLVIVGTGMASGRMLEHLFEADRDRFDITLFGAEPRGNYDRIMLSPVLAGEKSFDQIVTHDAAWYDDHQVKCRFGDTVTRIDRAAKMVHSARGKTPYDRLVIATGSAPFIIPVAGQDLPGVMTYRDLDDVKAMLARRRNRGAKGRRHRRRSARPRGGRGLKLRGMDVTVLHLMPTLMERQLDPAAGYLLQKALEERGIKVHCKAQTKAILGDGKVEGVELADGTVYPADTRGHGGRHPARGADRQGCRHRMSIAASSSTTRCGPPIRTSSRSANAPRTAASVYGLVAPLYDMASVAATDSDRR